MTRLLSTIVFIILFSFKLVAQQKTQIQPISRANSTSSFRVGCSLFTDSYSYSTGSSFSFNAPTNNNSNLSGGSGTNYGCMGSVPNQAWFIITVNTGGNLYFNFSNSNNYDVDAVVWGPIAGNDVSNACATTQSSPITCDFDASRPDLYINGATAGQKYVMLVTNYSNGNTVINVNQPSGGSVTYSMVNLPNCSIVPTASISGTSTSVSEGQGANLTLNFTGSSPWNYTLSDGTSGTTATTPLSLSVYPIASQTYTINSVNNLCGTSGGSGSVGISVTRNVVLKTCMPLDGNATDSQGLNSGTLQNGVATTTNRASESNKALLFDGIDDYVNLPTSQLNNATFSFAAWLKLDELPNVSNSERIALAMGGTGDQHYIGTEFYNGAAAWKFSSNGTDVYSNATVDLNWHLVIGVRTGGLIKIYVDGVLTGSSSVSGLATYGSPLTARIGSGIANNKFFKGKIDDVKIFNQSLIEPEILLLQNYNSCTNVFNDTYLSVQSLNTSVICTGSPFIINAFSNNILPDGQLQFVAELSDATGSFASPIAIGSSAFLPLSVTVPSSVVGGNYKIRIRYGGLISVNSFNVYINNPATYNISGSVALNDGQSTNLSLNFTGTGPWNYIMSNGLSGTATTSPWLITVTPDQNVTYSINSAQNVCGNASINGSGSATVTVAYTKQLVTCLPFNGNAIDGKTNNTTTVNGPFLTSSRYGQPNTAYEFNGTSNYIEYTTNLLRKREYTMSVWVLANSISGSNQYIISQGESGTQTFQGIGVNTSGWFFQSYGGSGASIAYSSSSLGTNQWVNLTAVRTYQSLKLYVNGVLATTTSNNAQIPFKESDFGRIGANSSTLGNYFNGKIDEVRLFKGALTDDEVYALYASNVDCPTVENTPIVVVRSISPGTVCAGNNISVSFTASNVAISQANPLSVQLSDQYGSFATPVILGTGYTSPISVAVPANTVNSAYYRIRLVTSGGAAVSSVNSSLLTVSGSLPTATISGGGNIPFGGTSTVSLAFTGTAPYTFALNNGGSQSTSSNPLVVNVSPFGTTIYTVTSISNSCGGGTSSGSAVVNVAPNIALGSIGAVFCAGQTFSIPFTSNFSATPNFRAELSSSLGDFSNPVIIGTSISNTISASIPQNTAFGTSYKIRIVSDSPAYTSPEFSNITINALASVTLSGTTTINEGDFTNLTLNFTGTAPYTYTLAGSSSQSTSLSSVIIPVYPIVSTTYSVTSISNTCGAGTSTGSAIITVTPVPIRLVSCFPFDGNANDSKGFNNGTVNGASLTTDRFGNPNSAYNFNGNENKILFPANGLKNLNYTYSFWIKPASNLGYDKTLFQIGDSNMFRRISLSKYDNNNYITLFIREINNANLNFYQPTIPVVDNQWINLIFVSDGNYLYIYSNGTLVYTLNNFNSNFVFPSNSTSLIGSGINSGFSYIGGLDDVQFYKGALTAEQVAYIYNSSSPCSDPSLLPFLTLNSLSSASFCQNQTFTFSFTSVNVSPSVGSPVNVELSDASGSFTSPTLIGTSTSTSGSISVQIPSNQTSGTGYKIRLKQGSTISNLSGQISISAPVSVNISGTNTINEGEATNLTLSFTGTTPYTYTITGGSSQTTSLSSVNIPIYPIINSSYSVASISNICGAGTSTGSAIITVTPVPIRLVSCFPFTGNANDSKGLNNGTVFGATLTSDRFGNPNSAYSFNGVNNYVEFPTSQLENDLFTFSAWVLPYSSAGASNLFIMNIGGSMYSQSLSFLFGGPNDSWSFRVIDGNLNIYSASTNPQNPISINNWYHIVGVRESSQIKLFVNGVYILSVPISSGSTQYRSNNVGETVTGTIGVFRPNTNFNHFYGKIDDVQIYKGALTAEQVAYIYNSSAPCADPSLLPFLTLNSLSSESFCQNQTFTLPFTSVNVSPSVGSPVNVELSDASGSFASPTLIGTSTSTSGSISVQIPSNQTSGTGYKIRLKQGSIISNLSGQISISAPVSVSISGTNTINEGEATNLTLSFTGTTPYTYTITGGSSQTTSLSSVNIPIYPIINSSYSVASISNICGAGTSTGSAIITVTPVPIRLVSCFPFNGNANDSKGFNNGTVTGATLTTDRASVSNSAYLYDGNNDYVTLSASGLSIPYFSYSIWANITAPKVYAMPNEFVLFQIGNESSKNQVLSVSYTPDMGFGPERFYLNYSASGVSHQVLLSNISFNQWNSFAVTRSESGYKLYFNGQALTTDIGVISSLLYQTNPSIVLGKSVDGYISSGDYKGKLDNFQAYKGALTAGQVQALYQNTSPCFDATTYTCLSDNIFTSMLSGSQTMQVSNQIIGRSSVQSGANIHFDSKNSILLEPGFKTEGNSVFKATVGGGCL